MKTCAECGMQYAEVVGAPEQRCPRCGHRERSAPTPAAFGAPPRVDPVAAASLAFRHFVSDYPFLLLLWLPSLVLGSLLQVLLVMWGAPIDQDPWTLTDAERLTLLGQIVPGSFVLAVVDLALYAPVAARLMDKRDDGARLRALRARWGGALAAGALLALAYVTGIVLLLIPFFIFLHRFLYVQAALADGATLREAFERSRDFAKERKTAGFTALFLVLSVLVIVASGVIGAVLAGAVLALGGSAYGVALATSVSAWLVGPLMPLFPAAYWALARAAAQASPPPASTRPAERFRTTKCPQCGTLVPYTATGAPVDVSCPVCGRTGRVL